MEFKKLFWACIRPLDLLNLQYLDSYFLPQPWLLRLNNVASNLFGEFPVLHSFVQIVCAGPSKKSDKKIILIRAYHEKSMKE